MKAFLAGLLVLLVTTVFAPRAQAADYSVDLTNYSFSPATLTVKVGDTVTWTNHDQAPHDATTTSAPAPFKSPELSTGESWTYTFTTAGTYSYYCSIHPDMRAQIIVQAAAASTATPVPAPAAVVPKTTTQQKQHPTTIASAAAPMPSMSATAATPQTAPSPQESSASSQANQAQPVTSAATVTTVNPMLLVAGITAGITMLCLLAVTSRRET